MNFYRVEHHTIMSGLVVRFRLAGEVSDFEISASRDGVMMQGSSPYFDMQASVQIAQLLQRAEELHLTIRDWTTDRRRPSWFEFDHDPPCVVELHKAHFADDDEIIARREAQRDGS